MSSFLLSCAGDVPVPEFRIGVMALMAERYVDPSGVPTIQGAEMAAEEINRAGGVVIDGVPHRIRLVVKEHDEPVEDVTSGARALINLDSVHVLVGPQLSRHAIPVGGVANDAGIPMVSPMSSNPETTRGRPFAFRLAFLDQAQGEALARYGREALGLERVGVLTDVTDPYSRDLSALFVEVFGRMGGETVSASYVSGQEGSARGALRSIASHGPDRILLPIRAADMLEVMRVAEAEDLGIPFLGSDTWSLEDAAPLRSAEGAVVSHQWHGELPVPEARRFDEDFLERYGTPPRATAALTYDAVWIVARAAAEAGSLDGTALRDALHALPAHRGASGTIHFRGSGDPSRSVVLSKVEGGRAHFLAVVDPS